MLPFSLFDAHCDTLSRCSRLDCGLRANTGHTDLTRGMQFRHYAQVFAVFRDGASPPLDGMFAEFTRQTNLFFQQMRENADWVMHCRSRSDLQQAAAEHKAAALLSVEGAELLECDPGRIDIAAELGVCMINLTWHRANALSGSHMEEAERGLSLQGKDFVRRAQEAGILVDVSHLSDAGFWDLINMTQRPVVASHSDARVLSPHTRNLTDDMFRAIRDTGGFVGINFYVPFLGRDGSLDAVFAHLEHFLDLDGEKTVGFGGDWDGCDLLPKGIGSIEDMEKGYDRMLQRNYPQELIDDIFYHNLECTIFTP